MNKPEVMTKVGVVMSEEMKLVPIEPTEAMLRPFYDCPPDELRLAWDAMLMIADTEAKRAPAHADEPVARYADVPMGPVGVGYIGAHPSAGIRSEWMPIETAPFEDVADSGKWLQWCLLGRRDAHGWVEWVGGMDADMWLHRDDTRACGDCETPTHWMPLPAPPRALGESS